MCIDAMMWSRHNKEMILEYNFYNQTWSFLTFLDLSMSIMAILLQKVSISFFLTKDHIQKSIDISFPYDI